MSSTQIDSADATESVIAVIDDLYRAVFAGDRPGFDVHLAADATMWETERDAMMRGVDDLTRHRDQRDEVSPLQLSSLTPRGLEVTVRGDTAIARYLLAAHGADGNWTTFRVTDVLGMIDGDWLIVHHHAEVRPGTSEPQDRL